MIPTTNTPPYSSAPLGSSNMNKYEKYALSMINAEKTQWNEMAVNVTTKVQYLMRNVIDQSRRYYSGVFENQFDEQTGDRKIWAPMTETAVDQVVKSIDLDTKDILIEAGTPSAVPIVPLVRASILNLFKKIGFGQLLNMFTETVARDGTVVVKSCIDTNPNNKQKQIRSYIVDIMNLWVDPSANTLQDSAVIERSILSPAEVETYRGVWDNIDKISYTSTPEKLTDIFNLSPGKTPMATIWERWGLIPKSLITNKESDERILIEGHIIASGIGSPSVIHLIRKNPRKDGRKPYEECWYRRINGRWPGRGIPEMLFGLQEYVNEVVNTRRSNNKVLQNGIFLIRKGSGITPDMLNAITAGGGLSVTNIQNDIKQLTVQDYRQSSYTDEDRVQLMADRVTGAFDIGRGEVGRASASATATLTRDRNIRDTFVLVQENIGFFIERLIRFQYIPLLQEIMTEEDFIKVTGDADYLNLIDEQIINARKAKFIQDSVTKTSFHPEQDEIDGFVKQQADYLKKMGKQRFVKYFREIFNEEVDIEIHITDEKFNRVVAVQQLRDALVAYSRLPVASKLDTDAILREMFNIMGIKGEFFLEKPQLPNSAFQSLQNGPRLMKEFPQTPPNDVTAFENANKLPQQQPPGMQSMLDIRTGLSNLSQ